MDAAFDRLLLTGAAGAPDGLPRPDGNCGVSKRFGERGSFVGVGPFDESPA